MPPERKPQQPTKPLEENLPVLLEPLAVEGRGDGVRPVNQCTLVYAMIQSDTNGTSGRPSHIRYRGGKTNINQSRLDYGHATGVENGMHSTTLTMMGRPIPITSNSASTALSGPHIRPSRENVLRRLSEALLRHSLTKIDLSQRGLCPDDARLVKMALLQNAHLSVLKLGYNVLQDRGTEILATGIAVHGALELLDLGFNDIGDAGCQALATALIKNSQGDGMAAGGVGGGNGGCALHTLYLAGNCIGEIGATALADAIQHGHCANLRKLYLTGNRIGPDGVKAIADALVEVELRRNDQEEKSSEAYVDEGDLDQRDQIVLEVDDDPNDHVLLRPPSHRPVALGEDTSASTTSLSAPGLEELFLGGTGMGLSGCQSVARFLRRTSRLKVLSLTNCDLDDAAVADLASSIKANRDTLPLESLQLSFNQITDRGMESLANAIWGSSTLCELLLDNNQIGDRGAQQIAAVMPFLKTLQTLNVGFNSMRSAGIKFIMMAVADSSSLSTLSVSGNAMDTAAAKSAAYALAYNRSLLSLSLVNCLIEKEGQRHISAGIVSNLHLSLREITGFDLGPVIVTLGFPAPLQHWNNDQMLNFIHLMWDRYATEVEAAAAFSEEEKKFDPLHFLDNPLSGRILNSRPSNGKKSMRPAPLEASIVVEIAKKAFATLMADGVDVFSRRPSLRHDIDLASPIATDSIMVDSDGSTIGPDNSVMDNDESTMMVFNHETVLNSFTSSSIGGSSSPADPSSFWTQQAQRQSSKPSTTSSTDNMPTAQSFVAPPQHQGVATGKPLIPDPRRKKRIVEWLCSHIQHLNRLRQLPFNSADLWKLHQHYFTPVVNESGGKVVNHSTLLLATDPVPLTICSVPEVSRPSSNESPEDAIMKKASEDALASIPVSDPSMKASPGLNSLPILKRKVSYRFLGDASAMASASPTEPRHWNVPVSSSAAGFTSVSGIIACGPTGQSMPPKTKRARRNRSRISFLPRIKARLDSYLDVCHEKALTTMRQLYYVEQAILAGQVNPIDPSMTQRTHLCGDFAADAETIVVDML